MDIKAQFFACFSQKLAPARKNSTDWSARSARFCSSECTFNHCYKKFHIFGGSCLDSHCEERWMLATDSNTWSPDSVGETNCRWHALSFHSLTPKEPPPRTYEQQWKIKQQSVYFVWNWAFTARWMTSRWEQISFVWSIIIPSCPSSSIPVTMSPCVIVLTDERF